MENSIRAYQDKEFYYINRYLRNIEEEYIKNDVNEDKILVIKQHIMNIDEMFRTNSMKSDDSLIVFRGVNGNVIYQGIDNGFVSTSKSIKIAEKFAGKEGVIYEMRLEKNVSYLDLTMYCAREQEILLPRGLIFTIESQKKVKKNVYVVMRVTNNENLPI